MFRFIRRKLFLLVVLIAIFLALKKHLPNLGKTIGEWISGTADNYVAEVFSNVLDAFKEGRPRDAVEVFYDGLQSASED